MHRGIGSVGVVASAVFLAVVASCGGEARETDAVRASGSVSSAPTSVPVDTTAVPASSSSVTTTATSTSVPPPSATDCLARAPLAQVVGQLVLTTVPEAGIADVVPVLSSGLLGGIVLVQDASADVALALAPLADISPPPVVAVDEEGGTVQRLAAALGGQESARALAATGDPAAVFAAGEQRAAGAGRLGFTMILAPVLDVGGSAGSTTRAYGDDAETVLTYGLAYADGIVAGGLVAVVKHFPGHGSADADSHVALPGTPPLAEMRERDLVPFVETAGRVPAAMTGHLDVPGLTGGLPASLSAAALTLLRDEIGFDGLVITDDLSMGALSAWTVAEAAELAIAVGNDLLIAGGPDDAVASADRLAEAVLSGRLDRLRVDEAVVRVLASKGLGACDAWPIEG
ncbi:MAG: glycoside hydrolase family 3 N-terminal domain-containing protein [Acidimicrobiales bacterium]